MGSILFFLIFFFLSFVLLLNIPIIEKTIKIDNITEYHIVYWINVTHFYLFNIIPGLQAMGSD